MMDSEGRKAPHSDETKRLFSNGAGAGYIHMYHTLSLRTYIPRSIRPFGLRRPRGRVSPLTRST